MEISRFEYTQFLAMLTLGMGSCRATISQPLVGRVERGSTSHISELEKKGSDPRNEVNKSTRRSLSQF